MGIEIAGANSFGKIDGYVKHISRDRSKSTGVSDDRKTDSSTGSQDSVKLSPEARTMGMALNEIKRLPDIREDKVAEIRKQIADGTYQVDGKRTAGKMIRESMFNSVV